MSDLISMETGVYSQRMHGMQDRSMADILSARLSRSDVNFCFLLTYPTLFLEMEHQREASRPSTTSNQRSATLQTKTTVAELNAKDDNATSTFETEGKTTSTTW
jgi:hypothetical protein